MSEDIGVLKNDERFLFEMAQIGSINNTKTIYIRSNDLGNIPHFHIVDKSTLGNIFHTCVEIKTNRYFHHTGKEDTLNSEERKSLNDFFKQTDKDLGITNWKYLINTWNRNNSNMIVNIDQEQPDYTNIDFNPNYSSIQVFK